MTLIERRVTTDDTSTAISFYRFGIRNCIRQRLHDTFISRLRQEKAISNTFDMSNNPSYIDGGRLVKVLYSYSKKNSPYYNSKILGGTSRRLAYLVISNEYSLRNRSVLARYIRIINRKLSNKKIPLHLNFNTTFNKITASTPSDVLLEGLFLLQFYWKDVCKFVNTLSRYLYATDLQPNQNS